MCVCCKEHFMKHTQDIGLVEYCLILPGNDSYINV